MNPAVGDLDESLYPACYKRRICFEERTVIFASLVGDRPSSRGYVYTLARFKTSYYYSTQHYQGSMLVYRNLSIRSSIKTLNRTLNYVQRSHSSHKFKGPKPPSLFRHPRRLLLADVSQEGHAHWSTHRIHVRHFVIWG